MVIQKASGAVVPKSQAAASQVSNYEQISQDPLKHVITFIEKKIRNLDKRKAKLDGYRRMVEDGKQLDPDQTAAASKYNEVLGSLDFAKDLVKTFEATTTEVMKLQRKAVRREQMAKEETDNNRVCFVIRATRIMELLYENEMIKEDFLNGTNGACIVSKLEMDQLVNFYELFVMKTYEPEANIIEDATSAGNHMYELAEARSKDIVGTTYKELRIILDRISDCKYFEDLPDTSQVKEMPPPTENEEVESESSESSVEEELEKEEENTGADQSNNAEEPNALPPASNDPIDGAEFTAEVKLKTDEILPPNNATYPSTHTDNSWQQGPVPSKPEAGDYILSGLNFQYGTGSNQMLQQQTQPQQQQAYPQQVQSIQDVLADVQGPCQFLQDSVIEFDVGCVPNNAPVLSFTGMDMLQQPVTSALSSTGLTHPIDHTSSHIHSVPGVPPLETGFPNQQKSSPIDQAAMQHLAATRDSPSNLANTVTHPEHVAPSVDHMREPLHKPTNQETDSLNHDTVNYHGSLTQQPYISAKLPTSTSPSSISPQSNMEYLSHQMQAPATLQQPDNLGLGQTTFGGQQQPTGTTHTYQQDENQVKPNATYNTGTNGISDMIPHKLSSPSLQTPDPPTTHIPLPNEQQSGYRSYQPSDDPQGEANVSTTTNSETPMLDQSEPGSGLQNDAPSSQDQRSSETDDAKLSSNNAAPAPVGQKEIGDHQTDQNSRYGTRDNRGNLVGGRSMRGYSSGGPGYRSGPINQSGGGSGNYHSQRSGYRPNNRYNGSYDSMGRPSSYGGGYQNNQSSYGMYRSQQDGYIYNRRGAGGNMRGGRGGHPSRGNQRGSGGFSRSRTFRPQHSNEQSA